MDWDIIPFSSSKFATLRVAKRMFMINSDAIYCGDVIRKQLSGLLSVNDEGNGLIIKNLENVTKVDGI